MDHLYYFCLVLLCFHASLFVDALWPTAGKGLNSWLSFVMSNCDLTPGSGVVLDCIDSWSLPSFLPLYTVLTGLQLCGPLSNFTVSEKYINISKEFN